MTKYEIHSMNYYQGETEDDVIQLIEESKNGFVKLRMVKNDYSEGFLRKTYKTKFFNISQISRIEVIE